METLDSPKRSPAGFWMLLCLLLLAGGAKAILYDSMDPDCFWHLRVADQLLRDGIGPLVDDISFASTKEPWTPYSWLAELGMKLIWDTGGYRLAVATHTAMVAGILLCIALSCREHKSSDMGVLIVTACAAFWMLPYLSFRPVTFAILLLSIVMWLIQRDRRMNYSSRAIWMVAPITILLTNVHLFAWIVPIWMAIGTCSSSNRKRAWTLSILTGIACLLTPMLPGMLRTMVHFQFGDAMVAGPFIAETQPYYSSISGQIGLVIVGILLICTIARRSEMEITDWLMLIVGLVLLLRMGRFATLFAPMAAYVFAKTLPRLSDRILQKPILTWATALLLCIGSIRIVSAFPKSDQPLDAWLNRHFDTGGYPTGAASFVATNARATNSHVLTEFGWGGYLAWRLGENSQVFLDGRTQLYSNELWQSTYLADAVTRRDYLSTVKADIAIVPVERSVFREDLKALGWKTIFEDARAVTLVPPATAIVDIQD